MNHNYEEFNRLMNEFKDGKELYENSPIFNACFRGILAGGSIYKILEEVINIQHDTQKQLSSILNPSVMNCFSKIEKSAEMYRKEYYNARKHCPKCFSENHSSTLVGYIIDMSKPEAYRDDNRCVCEDCGDVHTTHYRVGPNIFKLTQLDAAGVSIETVEFKDIFKDKMKYSRYILELNNRKFMIINGDIEEKFNY